MYSVCIVSIALQLITKFNTLTSLVQVCKNVPQTPPQMPSPVPEDTPDTTADDFLLEALTPLEFDDLSLQPALHTEVLTAPINVNAV